MPLGLRVVIDDKSWLLWYNYYIVPLSSYFPPIKWLIGENSMKMELFNDINGARKKQKCGGSIYKTRI